MVASRVALKVALRAVHWVWRQVEPKVVLKASSLADQKVCCLEGARVDQWVPL